MEYRREEWRNKERKKRDGERREERGKGGQCTIRPNRFLPVYQPDIPSQKLAKRCKIG
jgi:hypothetical protein